MADLVDWLHGDASTEWGAKRIAAGHPQPYNLTHFEFGANLNAKRYKRDGFNINRYRVCQGRLRTNERKLFGVLGLNLSIAGNEQGIDAAVKDFGRIVTAMETRRASRCELLTRAVQPTLI
jgi:alpha-L-arabinofuranosidase